MKLPIDISTQEPTPTQLAILKIIYKFRFVTVDLVAMYRSTTKNASYELVAGLYKSGYVARRYDSSYKLQGKGARYYLAPKSLKYLEQEAGLNERVLHARYKDKHLTESFVSNALGAFKAAIEIHSAYPGMFTVFSRYELVNYPQFPKPLPALYVKRNKGDLDELNEYFLEVFGNADFSVVKKIIDKHIENYEQGVWQGESYPRIIFQISNAYLQKKVGTYLNLLIENGLIDEDELIIRAVPSITVYTL